MSKKPPPDKRKPKTGEGARPVAAKAPAEDKAEPREPSALDKKAEARAFMGKKGLITVDGMKPMYGPGTGGAGGAAAGGAVAPMAGGGISAAALASAALAQRLGGHRGPSLGEDALAEFRATGTWKAPAIYRVLDGGAEGLDRTRKSPVAPGLLATARAWLGVAIYGEVQGVRTMVAALARSDALDVDARRELEGIGRAAGSRQLTLDQLKRLVPIALAAAGGAGTAAEEGAKRLVSLGQSARPVGSAERSLVTPKQLVELRPREACLVILDLPAREVSQARRPQEFTLVVGLLRSQSGELVMADPQGLFDPIKGTHDEAVRYGVLHRAQEVGLGDFVAGTGTSPPQSPVGRLVCNAYLSAATPRKLSKEEVPVVGGLAFRFL